MTFHDFVHKYNVTNKATSNIKKEQVLSFLSLNDVGIYLRDRPFKTDRGIVSLHPSKGTHWFCYVNENYFKRYDCDPPQKPTKFIIKRDKQYFYSEYKIQV